MELILLQNTQFNRLHMLFSHKYPEKIDSLKLSFENISITPPRLMTTQLLVSGLTSGELKLIQRLLLLCFYGYPKNNPPSKICSF